MSVAGVPDYVRTGAYKDNHPVNYAKRSGILRAGLKMPYHEMIVITKITHFIGAADTALGAVVTNIYLRRHLRHDNENKMSSVKL